MHRHKTTFETMARHVLDGADNAVMEARFAKIRERPQDSSGSAATWCMACISFYTHLGGCALTALRENRLLGESSHND